MLPKPSLENIGSKQGTNAFLAYRFSLPRFKFNWHYHPEYELTFIIKGEGMRLIGDSYERFSHGDLVLIGPNLPHSWASEASNGYHECVVVQFSENFINGFLNHNEFSSIKRLLMASKLAIHFTPVAEDIQEDVQQLPILSGFDKTIRLLILLNKLSVMRFKLLASEFFKPIPQRADQDRVNKVFNYIHTHATEPISIQQLAEMINLSESAFCKFFKRASGKTFSDYLNELRIGHACSLLAQTENTVAQVAYAVGFESVTYFNRVFLRKKRQSTEEFQEATLICLMAIIN